MITADGIVRRVATHPRSRCWSRTEWPSAHGLVTGHPVWMRRPTRIDRPRCRVAFPCLAGAQRTSSLVITLMFVKFSLVSLTTRAKRCPARSGVSAFRVPTAQRSTTRPPCLGKHVLREPARLPMSSEGIPPPRHDHPQIRKLPSRYRALHWPDHLPSMRRSTAKRWQRFDTSTLRTPIGESRPECPATFTQFRRPDASWTPHCRSLRALDAEDHPQLTGHSCAESRFVDARLMTATQSNEHDVLPTTYA
jgi:hypothetical protein